MRENSLVVHAVQRPQIPEGEKAITFTSPNVLRKGGVKEWRFDGTLNVHVPSTGRVDVKMSWEDWTDNPSLLSWFQAEQQADAFRIVVNPTALSPVSFAETQPFRDTKHHLVYYLAHAWSSLVEYYPELAEQPGALVRV